MGGATRSERTVQVIRYARVAYRKLTCTVYIVVVVLLWHFRSDYWGMEGWEGKERKGKGREAKERPVRIQKDEMLLPNVGCFDTISSAVEGCETA